MKVIKVLGSGCANCATTANLIQEIISEEGIQASVEKIEDIAAIMGYGVMSTPGVVIDETVVHAGGIPTKDAIKGWLKDQQSGCCSGSSSNKGNCCG